MRQECAWPPLTGAGNARNLGMRSRTREGDGGISVFCGFQTVLLKTASESGLAESNGGGLVLVGFPDSPR